MNIDTVQTLALVGLGLLLWRLNNGCRVLAQAVGRLEAERAIRGQAQREKP
jgi:hypothetical protein